MADTKRKDVLEGLEGYTPGPWHEGSVWVSTGLGFSRHLGRVYDSEDREVMMGTATKIVDGAKLNGREVRLTREDFPGERVFREGEPFPHTPNARLIARAPELVDEIRRLRKGLAEIGGEWDPHIRPSGSNEIWVAEIAARARALLPDTEDE